MAITPGIQAQANRQLGGADVVKALKERLIGVRSKGQHGLFQTAVHAEYGYESIESHQDTLKTPSKSPPVARKRVRPSILLSLIKKRFEDGLRLMTKEDQKRCRRAELTATKLYQHWTAAPEELELQVGYCNRMLRMDTRRYGLFVFDFDSHEGQTLEQAQDSASRLMDLLGIVHPYCEPSTSGRGIHAYVLIEWPSTATTDDVAVDLEELRVCVSDLTTSCPVACDEILGRPLLRRSGRLVYPGGKHGWARVPRPLSPSAAQTLLRCIDHSESMTRLLDDARKARYGQAVSSAAHKNVSPLLKQDKKKILEKTSKGGTGGKKRQDSKREGKYSIGVNSGENTNERTRDYLCWYLREHGIRPLDEIQQAYHEAGLAISSTGDDDRKLAHHYEWAVETYTPASALARAQRIINQTIEANGTLANLEADLTHRRKRYSERTKLKALTPELLAQSYCIIVKCLSAQGGSGGFGKRYLFEALKQNYGVVLDDGKIYRAIIQWLRRNRLIRMLDNRRYYPSANGKGRCRVFELVETPTKTPSKSPPDAGTRPDVGQQPSEEENAVQSVSEVPLPEQQPDGVCSAATLSFESVDRGRATLAAVPP